MNLSSPLKVTPSEAASLLLAHHNLSAPQSLKGKEEALGYIRKTGCIQYDPLNVCGRNPDLVLQSRIADYSSTLLEELLYTDRSLLEGWDKMMAIFPSEDRPLLSRLRSEVSSSYIRHYPDVEAHLASYLDEIRKNGPLSSSWFKNEEKISWAWGSSRLSKAALECLFFQGRISIHHRENTKRFYDISERLLSPSLLDAEDPFDTEEEYRRTHILRRVNAAGIAGYRAGDFWQGIAGTPKKEIRRIAGILCEEGLLRRLEIEGSGREWFISSGTLEAASSASSAPSGRAVLLAPLDNMMWNRDLLEDIFDFRYRWEVYTPAAKREYGYYVLPILFRGRLIGRCEPAMDRKRNVLVLKGFWLQDGIHPASGDYEELRAMFARFCGFLGADRMVTTPSLGREFRRAFRGMDSREIRDSVSF